MAPRGGRSAATVAHATTGWRQQHCRAAWATHHSCIAQDNVATVDDVSTHAAASSAAAPLRAAAPPPGRRQRTPLRVQPRAGSPAPRHAAWTAASSRAVLPIRALLRETHARRRMAARHRGQYCPATNMRRRMGSDSATAALSTRSASGAGVFCCSRCVAEAGRSVPCRTGSQQLLLPVGHPGWPYAGSVACRRTHRCAKTDEPRTD